MLFATVLGLMLGAAAVLLLEQWLRAELAAAPRRGRPRISRASGALAPPPRRAPLR